MEWPAQQKDKARKEGQKKRGGESEKKKKNIGSADRGYYSAARRFGQLGLM